MHYDLKMHPHFHVINLSPLPTFCSPTQGEGGWTTQYLCVYPLAFRSLEQQLLPHPFSKVIQYLIITHALFCWYTSIQQPFPELRVPMHLWPLGSEERGVIPYQAPLPRHFHGCNSHPSEPSNQI